MFFSVKGAIYYVARATYDDISRVKIYNMFIFFTCEDIMFSRERLPGI